MTRHVRPAAALALALAAALPLVPAHASERDARRTEESRAVAAARIDATAAIAAVRAAGYGPVSELDWEHDRWEVKATDAEGRRVALHVDAATGAVAHRGR
ncbi:PepSY domain-containing protein [Roseomonas sp. HJA6]|uniref:PepSY domain-containing protein n=1 Tax=Roseomonas alba TaxID=2846776 RepID=A0ABS7AGG4_9PROT|nr:PepSY domain-containing protein [Neoroseomonas alba]MBW6401384.1 PepSY domain-containing protein [Neoroseomonas alba]